MIDIRNISNRIFIWFEGLGVNFFLARRYAMCKIQVHISIGQGQIWGKKGGHFVVFGP